MKRKRFTEAQIVFALRQAESGIPVAEIIRKIGDLRGYLLPLEEEVCRFGGGGRSFGVSNSIRMKTAGLNAW